MKYARAKEIANAHAPQLVVGDEVKGQAHIDVHFSINDEPSKQTFSIMLPPDTADEDGILANETTFKASLDEASRVLTVST